MKNVELELVDIWSEIHQIKQELIELKGMIQNRNMISDDWTDEENSSMKGDK